VTRRVLGAVLLAVAAAVAVVGTFLPLSFVGREFAGERIGYTTTGWDVIAEPVELLDRGSSAQYGAPITVSAVLLLVAAALVALPEHQRLVARYTAVASSALLAGSVWTTVTVVGASLLDELGAPDRIDFDLGAGVWLLIASVLVAVVGTVLLHARPASRPDGPLVRRVDGGDYSGSDTATPPYGIPVAVVPETTGSDGNPPPPEDNDQGSPPEEQRR
jgi:hypothetical protein